MHNIKYIYSNVLLAIALLLILAAPSRGTDSDSLTVNKAVALVLRNHPALQQAQQRIEASRALVGSSRSSFYPQVSGNGSYNRIGPVPTVDIPGSGSFSMAPANNWDFFLGVHQLVYDFGKREKGVDLARSGINTAQDSEGLIKSQLAYATVQVFYLILYLQQDIIVIDDQISNLNKLLDITKEKARTGSATDFDVLTTQVRVSAAQTRKVDIEKQLNNQITTLRQLTGLPTDQELIPSGDFTTPVVSPSADSLLEQAMKQRPEMHLAYDAVTTASLQHDLASLSRRPSLNVGVQLGFKNGYFPNLGTLKGDFVAGASVSMPIFTGFRIESQEHLTMADMNAARAHTRDVERQITAEVRQAIEDLRAGEDKIRTAEIQVRQAEEALKMAEVRYEAGVITNLDLLDAQTSVSQARLALIGARYGYVISKYALDQATGAPVWDQLTE